MAPTRPQHSGGDGVRLPKHRQHAADIPAGPKTRDGGDLQPPLRSITGLSQQMYRRTTAGRHCGWIADHAHLAPSAGTPPASAARRWSVRSHHSWTVGSPAIVYTDRPRRSSTTPAVRRPVAESAWGARTCIDVVVVHVVAHPITARGRRCPWLWRGRWTQHEHVHAPRSRWGTAKNLHENNAGWQEELLQWRRRKDAWS